MAMADHDSKVQVKYSKETCFKATTDACKGLDGFTIDRVDNVTSTIYLKGRMSLFSFGELITISINTLPSGLSEIFVSSSPKVGMSANAPGIYGDMGKNKKNIIKIHNAISDELAKHPEDAVMTNTTQNSDTIFEKIEKLKSLLDGGFISSDDYEIKKAELMKQI